MPRCFIEFQRTQASRDSAPARSYTHRMDIAALRKSYEKDELDESASAADPLAQFHRIGFGQLGLQSLVEPALKLRQRVGGRGRFVQLVFFVAFAQCGDVHAVSVGAGRCAVARRLRRLKLDETPGQRKCIRPGAKGSIPYVEGRK